MKKCVSHLTRYRQAYFIQTLALIKRRHFLQALREGRLEIDRPTSRLVSVPLNVSTRIVQIERGLRAD